MFRCLETTIKEQADSPGFCDQIFQILLQFLLNSAAIFINPNIENLHNFLHDQEIL